MSLLEKRLEDIKEADLDSLIASQIPESRVIEYKRDQIGNTDRDRAEFLADVTSLLTQAGVNFYWALARRMARHRHWLGLILATSIRKFSGLNRSYEPVPVRC